MIICKIIIIRSFQNVVIQKLAPSFLTFESVDTLIVHLPLAVLNMADYWVEFVKLKIYIDLL